MKAVAKGNRYVNNSWPVACCCHQNHGCILGLCCSPSVTCLGASTAPCCSAAAVVSEGCSRLARAAALPSRLSGCMALLEPCDFDGCDSAEDRATPSSVLAGAGVSTCAQFAAGVQLLHGAIASTSVGQAPVSPVLPRCQATRLHAIVPLPACKDEGTAQTAVTTLISTAAGHECCCAARLRCTTYHFCAFNKQPASVVGLWGDVRNKLVGRAPMDYASTCLLTCCDHRRHRASKTALRQRPST